MSKRIVVTMNDSEYESLRSISEKNNVSMAEVIRQSVRMKAVLENQSSVGFDKIIVANDKGKEKELLFLH